VFRVTLVWSDPEGVTLGDKATPLLVNNLDLLVVKHSSGDLLVGNHQHFADPLNPMAFDDVNNVEQISIQAVQAVTTYSVQVRGADVPKGPQRFALVINGNFHQQPLSACQGPLVCPNRCSGHGECATETGQCMCQPEFTGSDCSQTVESLAVTVASNTRTSTSSGTVASGTWVYYTVDTQNAISTTIVLSRSGLPVSGRGGADLFVSKDAKFPSIRDFDYRGIPSGADNLSIVLVSGSTTSYRVGVFGRYGSSNKFDLTITQVMTPA